MYCTELNYSYPRGAFNHGNNLRELLKKIWEEAMEHPPAPLSYIFKYREKDKTSISGFSGLILDSSCIEPDILSIQTFEETKTITIILVSSIEVDIADIKTILPSGCELCTMRQGLIT